MCRTTKFKLYEQKELKKDDMFGCNFCYNIKNLSDKHKLVGNKCLDCFERMKPKKEPKVLPTEKVCVACELLLPINKFAKSHTNKNTGWVSYNNNCYKCRYKKQKEYTNEYGKKYRKSMTIEQKEKYQPLKSLKFRNREQKKLRKEGMFGCNTCGEVKQIKQNSCGNQCKSCFNSQGRGYYYKNKDASWRNTYKWLKKKKSEDPFYRLVCNMRHRLWYEFKKINVKKDDSILEFLGITVGEFKSYMESKFKEGMTWDNYGIDGWHLDHIIPISSAKTEKDLKELSHYTNLQPLWAEENMKKRDKIL